MSEWAIKPFRASKTNTPIIKAQIYPIASRMIFLICVTVLMVFPMCSLSRILRICFGILVPGYDDTSYRRSIKYGTDDTANGTPIPSGNSASHFCRERNCQSFSPCFTLKRTKPHMQRIVIRCTFRLIFILREDFIFFSFVS